VASLQHDVVNRQTIMQTTITRPPELRDDDTPGQSECDPMDSAQARRAGRLPVVITPVDAPATQTCRPVR
jgi:hypothetical protein